MEKVGERMLGVLCWHCNYGRIGLIKQLIKRKWIHEQAFCQQKNTGNISYLIIAIKTFNWAASSWIVSVVCTGAGWQFISWYFTSPILLLNCILWQSRKVKDKQRKELRQCGIINILRMAQFSVRYLLINLNEKGSNYLPHVEKIRVDLDIYVNLCSGVSWG